VLLAPPVAVPPFVVVVAVAVAAAVPALGCAQVPQVVVGDLRRLQRVRLVVAFHDEVVAAGIVERPEDPREVDLALAQVGEARVEVAARRVREAVRMPRASQDRNDAKLASGSASAG
jgi:hypothetical protein